MKRWRVIGRSSSRAFWTRRGASSTAKRLAQAGFTVRLEQRVDGRWRYVDRYPGVPLEKLMAR